MKKLCAVGSEYFNLIELSDVFLVINTDCSISCRTSTTSVNIHKVPGTASD